MDTNTGKQDNSNASLPLPEGDKPSAKPAKEANAAADLIRKKVEAAYSKEPDAAEELEEISELGVGETKSKHQQFIFELTSSGKSLENIQAEWHDYYAGLGDVEKHQVWQEFYSAHGQASSFQAAMPASAPHKEHKKSPFKKADRKPKAAAIEPKIKPVQAAKPGALLKVREEAVQTLKSMRTGSPKDHLQSILFGLGIGCIVLAIFLFSFFNERFIAPFIQPSRSVAGTPVIGGATAAGNTAEVIIPKINVEIPVVYGVNTIDDNAIEAALEDGVVHYADTAMPGQNGNLVIVGHSSNNIFNKGKYKFAFVLLSRLDNGDTFYIQKDGKRYTYQVYKKTIVPPSDVSVLGPADKTATATLITCDPPGTSLNRLVVVGEQISPTVASNTPAGGQNTLATSAQVVPGNSPSLWSRLFHSL